jgi:predicted nucleotidyltransferase
MTQMDIVRLIRERLSTLRQEYGVKKIGLFGSALSDRFTETSDIDLLVEFEQPIGFRFFDLIEYLEGLLGRRVDVLTPDGVDSIRVPSIARTIRDTTIYV